MEGQETTQETPQSAPSASDLLGLLDGTVTPQPQVREAEATQETAAPPATEQTESVVDNTEKQTEASDIISLEDTTEVNPAQQASTDDFDKQFRKRLTKEFGLDFDTLKTKLSATAEPTYKTELAKKADEMLPAMLEKGLTQKDFFEYVGTDFDALPKYELLDRKLKEEEPSLTPEQRQVILASEYNLYEDANDQEKTLGEYKMSKDHRAALADFKTKQAALTKDVFTPKEATIDPAHVERQTYWKGNAETVVKSIDKVPVTIKVPSIDDPRKMEDVVMNFDIPAKDREKMQAWVAEQGANTGAKTPEEMKVLLTNAFLNQYRDKITQNAVQRAASVLNEQWVKKMANYTPPKGKTPPPAAGVKQGSATEFAQLMGL